MFDLQIAFCFVLAHFISHSHTQINISGYSTATATHRATHTHTHNHTHTHTHTKQHTTHTNIHTQITHNQDRLMMTITSWLWVHEECVWHSLTACQCFVFPPKNKHRHTTIY